MRTWSLGMIVCILLLLVFADASPARIVDLASYRFDSAQGEPALPAELRLDAGEAEAAGYYLVQSDQPITPRWRAQLEAAGATIYGYLQEFTFLVGMDARARLKVARLPGTHWLGAYHPAYKLSPMIGTREYRSPERAADPGLQIRVRVFRDPGRVADALADLGIEVLDYRDDGYAQRFLVRTPAEDVAAIARIPDVWWVEEQPEFFLLNNTTRWVVQSNVNGWTPLWDQGINGEGQIATIMDSGVDYNSCWFRESGSAPPGPGHRKVIDYATVGGGNPYDGCDLGHGSHVAGTMCGDQSYINPGNYNYNGMAYKAKMTVQDIGADDWSACNIGLVAAPTSLAAPLSNSYALGARVHQNSWGSTSNAYDDYCVDVDYAMWNHKDFLVCFAAGNAGPSANTVGSPGTAKNCITVGATEQAPNQDVVASYSSRGPASSSDARMKPTLTAPGGEDGLYIRSVDNDPGNPPAATCQTVAELFKGTSMATPCVSGMALNVRQYYMDGFYPQGAADGEDVFTPSAALIKASLVNSTADMATPNIPNNNEGWGRILVDNALYFEGDTRELIVADVDPGLQTGGRWTLDFEIEGNSEPLYAALVWTDYPGTSGSGVKLVNDLDLTVTAPGGTQYRGNVFSGGFSAAGGSGDHLNVEECVRLASPALGSWELAVEGYNVPQGPQPFAVVVNGAFYDWPPEDFSTLEPDPSPVARRARVAAQPNPVTGFTVLHYTVPAGHAGSVELEILDVSGRVVRHLLSKGQRAGSYTISWDGLDDRRRAVADGVYFARLRAGEATATGKIIVGR